MKLFSGYSKLTIGDSSVLLAGGGSKPISEFKIGDYLPLSGGTMTGDITWNADSHGIYLYNGCGIEKWSGYGPSLVAESGTDFYISDKSNRDTRYLILTTNNLSTYLSNGTGGSSISLAGNGFLASGRSTSYSYGYSFSLGDSAKSMGLYSGANGEEGGVVVSPDTCIVYNSSDTGHNFSVYDKDLGGDFTTTTSLTFDILGNGDYRAWSRGGFYKNGSDDNYALLGGGGHKALSDFSMVGHTHNYLPLSGGRMNQQAQIACYTSSTDTYYGGALQIMEYNGVTTDLYEWAYAPRISFHWGGRAVNSLGMQYDGNLAWGNLPLLHSGNYSSWAVPLSGGTMTGSLHLKYSYPLLQFNITEGWGGSIGYENHSNDSLTFSLTHLGSTFNFKSGHIFSSTKDYLDNTVTPDFRIGNSTGNASDAYAKIGGNIVWHAGNDGSGSGLDADTCDGYHASNLVKFYLSPLDSSAPANSAKSWFVNTMPYASAGIIYNVPGSEKTIIAGKSSGSYGHMLQLNYDDTYLRILRYAGGNWLSEDWERISAGYADSAGIANSVSWTNVTSGTNNKTLYLDFPSFVFRDANGGWILGKADNSSGELSLGSSGIAQPVCLNSSGGTVYLTGGGNVGIGTTSPGYKLDVNGPIYTNDKLSFPHGGSTYSWARINEGYSRTSIRAYCTAGESVTGAKDSYSIGIMIDGYYSFALAASGGGANLGWRNNSGTWYDIITSENIGSQSVNYATSAGNADTVDGYHASSFLQRKDIRSDQDDPDNLRYNFGGFDKCDFNGTYASEYPACYGLYISLAYNDNNTAVLLFFDCPCCGKQSGPKPIYVRTRGAGETYEYSPWGALAYLTDNVASATKLQTARLFTIGNTGKYFDGTTDVSWTLAEIGVQPDKYLWSELVSLPLDSTYGTGPVDWAISYAASHPRSFVYNTYGAEYSYLNGMNGTSYGTILKMGYTDRYLRILRKAGGSWYTTDWEKIYAGYADSAGNADTVDNKHASDFATSDHTHTSFGNLTINGVITFGTNDNYGLAATANYSQLGFVDRYFWKCHVGNMYADNISSRDETGAPNFPKGLNSAADITATNFYTTSDQRKKTNIIPISKSIRSFNLIDSGQQGYGYIAQELATEHPELVDTKDEYWTVNYNSAICLNIATIENDVDYLKAKISRLEAEISNLKTLLG